MQEIYLCFLIKSRTVLKILDCQVIDRNLWAVYLFVGEKNETFWTLILHRAALSLKNYLLERYFRLKYGDIPSVGQ